MLAFQKCMKEHGVDIQVATIADGSGGGVQIGGGPDAGTEAQPVTGEFDPKAMEEADKACRDLLPAGGMLGDPNATMDPALADQMLKFAQCMRDHGVDFPDPQFSGGGVMVQVGGGEAGAIDPTSETFQAAQEACGSELPGGAPFVVGGSSSRLGRERSGDRGQAVRGSLIAGAGLVLVVAAGADRRRVRHAAGARGRGSGDAVALGGLGRGPHHRTRGAADDGDRRRPDRQPGLRGIAAGGRRQRGDRDPPARGGSGHRAWWRALRARRARPPAAPLRRPPAVAPLGPEGLRRRRRAPAGAEPQGHGVRPQGHEGQPPLGREDDHRGQALAEGDRPQAGRHARRRRPRVPPRRRPRRVARRPRWGTPWHRVPRSSGRRRPRAS